MAWLNTNFRPTSGLGSWGSRGCFFVLHIGFSISRAFIPGFVEFMVSSGFIGFSEL